MDLTLLSSTVVEATANPLSRHGPEVLDFGDTRCVSPKTCSCWKSMLIAHFYLMNICFVKQKCVTQIKYLGPMPTFILNRMRRLCPSIFWCFSSSWWNFLPTVITLTIICCVVHSTQHIRRGGEREEGGRGGRERESQWCLGWMPFTVLTTVTPPKDQQRLSATSYRHDQEGQHQGSDSHLWRIGLFFSGEICRRCNVNFVLLVQHIHPLGPRPSNPESLWHQNVVCNSVVCLQVNCQYHAELAEASCCFGLNWNLCKAPVINGLP